MEKELKRALVLTGAIVLAALSAFTAAVAQTGFFTRLELSFTAGGMVTELYVQPGETPDVSGVVLPEGSRVLCWLDAGGGEAEPAVPAEADAEYEAMLGPALAGSMEPWLERDGAGFALPDAYVTGAELAGGLRSMFAAEVYTGALAGYETVSELDIAAAIEGLFAPDELPGLCGTQPLTRIEAADILYTLYMDARCGEWGFDSLYYVPAPDLDILRDGARELDACLTQDDEAVYEPGFHFIGGCLYRADDMGLLYMDETVDGIYYGPDGRATSGDAELDALVREALEPICAEYETREEMLRAAYVYVRDNFEYLRRNYYKVGDEGWQISEATTMLSTHRGNCYNYAAAFWALARGLGYDADAVAGTVGWNRSPHGWVIMDGAGGTRLVYDVELEMAYRYQRGLADTDLYAMDPVAAYSWNYIYGEQYR